MTPERLQQIEDLYHAALDRETAERAAFVDDSCNGDEELRHEVESLLASHEQAGEFIEMPVHEVAARLIADDQKRSMAGRAIGHYEIIELLGAGGMGEVYLARDMTLGRHVALKLLPDYFTRDEARVRRFQQEARTASGLNHPNILTIYEISQFEGQQYIATEFIEGETLRERLDHTTMKLGEALEIASQVAGALAAANEAGIVHRDIKPENIMIRRDGYVKVLDFGLAKLTECQTATASEAITQVRLKTDPGMVMGTVQYMSPEQGRGQEVDARTDIWSLGVVLYEMLTGRAPFGGETPSHVIVSTLEKEPPPLTRFTKVPAELERIVVKSLRKNKDERYQTARDLHLDLQSLKQEREVEAKLERVLPRPISSAEYVVRGIRGHPRTALLAAAAMIIAIAAIAYFAYFAKGGEAIDSIAVLPLVNVNGDPSLEYLSDGISDSIANSLSQLPNLRVIALSSVLQYKGKQVNPKQVGQQLSVRAVLMGRLIQRGDGLAISMELIDVRDNRRLWGVQYNPKLADITRVQTEIAQEISDGLRLRLSAEEKKQLSRRYTENSEAHEAYLQGRYFLSQSGTEAGQRTAIEYFEQAIKKDPAYAPAYVGLARVYWRSSNYSYLSPQDARQKGEAALQKALEIDDNLAEAHGMLAAFRQVGGDWPGAEKEFGRAMELNPRAWGVHILYAGYLVAIGRNDEAVAEAKRALEIDPLSPSAVGGVALVSLQARQYDQAIEFFRKAIAMQPNDPRFHNNLARALVQKGMYDEAIVEFQKGITLDNSAPGRSAHLAYTLAIMGKRAEAQKMLDELKERAKQSNVLPINFAIIYTGLGEKDLAFEWLEKAYKDRSGPPYLSIDNCLDALRTDRRFADLARRKGLAP